MLQNAQRATEKSLWAHRCLSWGLKESSESSREAGALVSNDSGKMPGEGWAEGEDETGSISDERAQMK